MHRKTIRRILATRLAQKAKQTDNAEALARATRNLKSIGQVTTSFLDKFLKGEQPTLLDAASSDHSEIRIRRFGPLEPGR